MLLALVAVAAGLLAGLATGRRPPADPAGWRLPWLIAAGAVLEISGEHLVGGVTGRILMDAGYAALVAFAVANGRRTGLVLVAAGLAANLLVIAIDAGMPVRGQPPGAHLGGQHHGLSSSDHLTFLADTIVIRPAHLALSPGDVVAALGAGVALFAWMETPDRSAPDRSGPEDNGHRRPPSGATRIRRRLSARL